MDPFHLAIGLGRCPVCGKGALFKGWLTLHETCEVCGSRYFRDPGNWTAPTAFGYGIGAATAVGTMVVLWLFDALVSGSEFLIIGVSVAVTLGSFRYVKAWWVAMLTRMGYVYPDQPEQPSDADPAEVAPPADAGPAATSES